MLLKKRFCILLIIFVPTSLRSQVIKIVANLTHSVSTDLNFIPTSLGTMNRCLDTTKYILPKKADYNAYAIFEKPLNSYQFFFDSYKKGLVPDSIFELIVQKNKLQGMIFSPDTNDYQIAVFIGRRTANTLEIIPDLNNNNRFDDDLPFTFSLPLPTKTFSIPNLEFSNIDYSTGKHRCLIKVPCEITIETPSSNIAEYKIEILTKEIWKGRIDTAGIHIQFTLNLIGDHDFDHYSDILISFGNILSIKEYDRSKLTYLSKGNIVRLKNYQVMLDSVSPFGEKAFFRLSKTATSFDPVKFISAMKGINTKNKRLGQIFKKGSFKIVDFWAIWCAPCLKQHESLRAWHNSLVGDKKISFVGVVLDNTNQFEKTIEYAKSSLPWNNYFVAKSTKEYAPFKYLGIETLPTYIIIDENNQIILETENIQEIDSYLRNMNKMR